MIRPVILDAKGRPVTAPARVANFPLRRPIRLAVFDAPAGFSPLQRHEVRPVNPSLIIPAGLRSIETPTTSPIAKPPRLTADRTKVRLAAVAAAAVTLLTPAIALAGTAVGATLETLFGGLGISSWAGAALASAGLIWTIKVVISRLRELKPENYQSPQSQLATNNPTPKKLMKILILPAFAVASIVGALMAYAPLAEAALNVSAGSLTWGAFWILGGLTAAKCFFASVKDFAAYLRYLCFGIQKNTFWSATRWKIATNIFGHGSWFVKVVLMSQLAKMFATQLINTTFTASSSGWALATGAAAAPLLPVMLKVALVAGCLGLIYAVALRVKAHIVGQPLGKHSYLKTGLVWALGGAAFGALATLTGIGPLATTLLCFAMTLGFGHDAIHSLRSAEGGLRQKDKVFPIFDLKSTWETVRSAYGDFRTVFKIAVDVIEPLKSAYVMTLISEGANWVINNACGTYSSAEYKQARLMIEKLINKDTKAMRQIYRQAYRQMKQALKTNDIAGATNAVAAAFEEIAKFLQEAAKGNLKDRSGQPFLGNTEFSVGKDNHDVTPPEKTRADHDLIVHGEHILFAARIYEELAERIRARGEQLARDNADPASLQSWYTELLEGHNRRAFPHVDTHPGRFWTNFLPDSYNAKQFLVDLCLQVMADFVGAMEVVVLNPRGQIDIWLVPLEVVREQSEDYKTVLTLESANDDLEDPRFAWHPRNDHDLANVSLCPISHISNRAHFEAYGTNPQIYPTAEVLDPPQLAKRDHYDVVYQNGARLRVFGDGHHELFGELPPNAPVVLMVPGTQRHQFIASQLASGQSEAALHGFPVAQELYSRLAAGDIPHPWGGSLSKDPLLMPRWHFMYPTEYIGISDADQMDICVTNLRLFHARSNPHLRVMMVRPRKEKMPFAPEMLENPGHDSFLEVGVALTWMGIKLKLKDGRELYMPLNLNKENERTFNEKGSELWRYIDERKPVRLVKEGGQYYLELPYRETATKDPSFLAKEEKIRRFPVPLEMLGLVGEIVEDDVKIITPNNADEVGIMIDPVRYGEAGGPIPVADYIFVRRNSQGVVTNQDRNKTLDERLGAIILEGTYALMGQKEIERVELVSGKPVKDNHAWTDWKGLVHVKMTSEEYERFKPWITPYQGQRQARYDEKSGELILEVYHFAQICNAAYGEFTYRRYLPDDRYRTFFVPEMTR